MGGDITILGNPGHGNGPAVLLLLAAEALQEATGRGVCLVLPFAGALRREIVARRKSNPRVEVVYDEALGEALGPVTLQNHDFAGNVAAIVHSQRKAQEQAARYIGGGLRVLDPAGQARRLAPEAIAFELNIGSRVRFAPVPRAFYFFPCLLSDLLRRWRPPAGEPSRDEALRLVEALEETYEVLFLPSLHTFSWDASWKPPGNARLVPFGRPAVEDPPSPPAPGLLAMPSGVGSAGNALIAGAVRQIVEEGQGSGRPLAVYLPLGAPLPEIPSAQPIHPDAIFSPAIEAVVGRAGWGTVGECFSAATPFIAIPALPGDDPEIGYNLKTLESSGIAVVYRKDLAILERLNAVRRRIVELRAKMERQFAQADGFRFMAWEMGRRLGLAGGTQPDDENGERKESLEG